MLELLDLLISHYEHTSDDFDSMDNKTILKELNKILQIVEAIGDHFD